MKLLDRLWGVLGLVETEDAELQSEQEKPIVKKERVVERKSEKNVPPLRQQAVAVPAPDLAPSSLGVDAVVISHPNGFDDARKIADHLTHNRTVVVNFEDTDSETTKRTVDFMSGITYAVGGGVQRISDNIFMFVPDRVEIVSTGHIADEGRGALPWTRS